MAYNSDDVPYRMANIHTQNAEWKERGQYIKAKII